MSKFMRVVSMAGQVEITASLTTRRASQASLEKRAAAGTTTCAYLQATTANHHAC